uniref:Heat shock protein 60 n=1 Tax=Giardia intestinalis TaxID=5741 RepID=HS60_GIAIN|nr:RecName: Full=Heat shock protein 60 [Giardia intestinalis]CAA34711.1 unnamed protein product [Giardia intestinalis]
MPIYFLVLKGTGHVQALAFPKSVSDCLGRVTDTEPMLQQSIEACDRVSTETQQLLDILKQQQDDSVLEIQDTLTIAAQGLGPQQRLCAALALLHEREPSIVQQYHDVVGSLSLPEMLKTSHVARSITFHSLLHYERLCTRLHYCHLQQSVHKQKPVRMPGKLRGRWWCQESEPQQVRFGQNVRKHVVSIGGVYAQERCMTTWSTYSVDICLINLSLTRDRPASVGGLQLQVYRISASHAEPSGKRVGHIRHRAGTRQQLQEELCTKKEKLAEMTVLTQEKLSEVIKLREITMASKAESVKLACLQKLVSPQTVSRVLSFSGISYNRLILFYVRQFIFGLAWSLSCQLPLAERHSLSNLVCRYYSDYLDQPSSEVSTKTLLTLALGMQAMLTTRTTYSLISWRLRTSIQTVSTGSVRWILCLSALPTQRLLAQILRNVPWSQRRTQFQIRPISMHHRPYGYQATVQHPPPQSSYEEDGRRPPTQPAHTSLLTYVCSINSEYWQLNDPENCELRSFFFLQSIESMSTPSSH